MSSDGQAVGRWVALRLCSGLAAVVCLLAGGCAGPRVVFVPSADAPARAGPNMRGRIYVWSGSAWELSRNRVSVPEGFYLWDAGGAAAAEKAGQ